MTLGSAGGEPARLPACKHCPPTQAHLCKLGDAREELSQPGALHYKDAAWVERAAAADDVRYGARRQARRALGCEGAACTRRGRGEEVQDRASAVACVCA